ncbi:MAG TPA: hypothetical protein EYG68_04360 [Leucothrix mucor]|nr:hypothetical protein [Leucothrix mucor]
MKKFTKLLTLLLLSLGSFFGYSWYDPNTPNIAPNWHYRVPITIPANTAVNSTIKFDVNFNVLMTQLGVTGTFDNNSPRIVRPNESLSLQQEFSDRIYNGVIDAASNGQGEIKFIFEDAGATTYYLYFDTIENGAKGANSQATINGNFEHSSGSVPSNWTISNVNANGAENNEVYDTSYGDTYSGTIRCSEQAINNADTSPNNTNTPASTTGRKWHLLGYRNKCEDGAGGTRESIRLSKSITIPATNTGRLDFFFQLQAYDNASYDFFQLAINNTPVNHTQLNIANTGNALSITTAGIGRRKQYSSELVDTGWQRGSLDLAPYANQTINISFRTNFFSDNSYRSWVKIDDIEWSIISASLGTPEMQLPEISMKKTSQTISDPVNGTASPKAIPGAIIEYTITLSNHGYSATDNNSISIIDVIPSTTALYVNDINAGGGPVNFSDGAIASGLAYNFINLSSNTDSVSFSNDGGTSYNYTPIADADGVDSNVTHIKIIPTGQLSANTAAGTPSCQIQFRVQVL